MTDFGSPTFKSPEFLAMNPNGLIPVLQDGDFSLFEGNAIMPYLAEKFGWSDLRAGPRQGEPVLALAPHERPSHHVQSAGADHAHQTEHCDIRGGCVRQGHARSPHQTSGVMEKFLVKDFVAETDHPTVADFAAYCEFVQIELMGIFDYSKYPKVSAWIERMKKLPHHDEIHATLDSFLASSGLKTKASS
ncbi:Thioredoxin-like fold [Phytophthora cactorum]|nr:Thioredoxin-like fold [Phytophthora cactorum]